MKRLPGLRLAPLLLAAAPCALLAGPPDAPAPLLFVSVDRIATMNADGVRGELIAGGWKTINKDADGLYAKKPDRSSLAVQLSRGKPIRVIAWLAPPFPALSPDLFRSVFGIAATPPPHDPFGPIGTGTSFQRGTNVVMLWNFKGTTRGRIFGPVYAAEVHRLTLGTGEECVVKVQLVDHATMKKWEDAP